MADSTISLEILLQGGEESVAKLKDVKEGIENVRAGLDKLDSVKELGASFVAGFQSATASASFFTDANQKIAESLQKVQSGMEMLEGFKSMAAGVKQMSALKDIIPGVELGFTSLKGAIASTGIGVLVVALGVLIANFDDIKKAITGNTQTWQSFKETLQMFAPPLYYIVQGVEWLAKNFDKVEQVASGVFASLKEGFSIVGKLLGDALTGHWGKLVDDAKNAGKDITTAFGKGEEEERTKQQNQKRIDALKAADAERAQQIDLLKSKGEDTYALELQQAKDRVEIARLEHGELSNEYKEALKDEEGMENEHNKGISEATEQVNAKRLAEHLKFEGELKKATESSYQYAVDKINEQAQVYAEQGEKEVEIEKWKKAAIDKLNEETDKAKKAKRDAFEQEQLKAGMSKYDWERKQLDKQAEEYKAAGVAQANIDTWLKGEKDKIATQETADRMKHDDEIAQHYIETVNKMVKATQDEEKEKEDALKLQLSKSAISQKQYNDAVYADKKNALNDEIKSVKAAYDADIADTTKTAEQKKKIEQAYNDFIKKLNGDLAKNEADHNNQAVKDADAANKAKIQIAQEGIQSISNLSNLVTQLELNNAKGNAAEKDRINKEAFERNKKIQIAQATLNLASGIFNIATNPSGIPDPFGAIYKGAEIAALVTNYAATVSKIEASQYNSSGAGSTGASSGAGAPIAANGVVLNAANQGTLQNAVTNANNGTQQYQNPVKVYVTESDITKAQNNVNRIKTQASVH